MDELEDFKSEINLTEYAAGQGYVLDRKASSRNSAVMRRDDGDKVVIARGQDRHWIYFSVRDDADNGSIVDFVQRLAHPAEPHAFAVLHEIDNRPVIGIVAHRKIDPVGLLRPTPRKGKNKAALIYLVL